MTDRGPTQARAPAPESEITDLRDHRRRSKLRVFIVDADADRRAPVLPPRPRWGPQLRRRLGLRGLRRRAAGTSTTALLPRSCRTCWVARRIRRASRVRRAGSGSLESRFLAVPYLIRLIGARTVLACGIGISITALWMMAAHFNPADDRRADHDLRRDPGLRDRPVVRAAELAQAVSLNPIHRTEGTIVATMAREVGLQPRHLDDVGDPGERVGAGPRPKIADRINCGDPVLENHPAQPDEDVLGQHRGVQRRGDAPGGDDRLRHHLRLDGALHRAAAAIAALDALAAAGDHGGDREPAE